jgi:hypothetical protein
MNTEDSSWQPAARTKFYQLRAGASASIAQMRASGEQINHLAGLVRSAQNAIDELTTGKDQGRFRDPAAYESALARAVADKSSLVELLQAEQQRAGQLGIEASVTGNLARDAGNALLKLKIIREEEI